jgi:hypothetical protein
MELKSVSATALEVASKCPSMFYAQNVLRAPAMGSNEAASLGTAVHGALENYVQGAIVQKIMSPTLDNLIEEYRGTFAAEFTNMSGHEDWYAQGEEMLKNWFARNDFSGFEVVSCEVKSSFNIPDGHGGFVPFNYIWDRCDKIINEDGTYDIRVVDYKTIRKPLSPDQLRDKVQGRCYAVAAAIQFPDARKIWIQFDLLRHDEVGVVFSRDDNIVTWNWVKKLVKYLTELEKTDDADLPESINEGCMYCIRKLECKTLNENSYVGGITNLFTYGPQIMADKRREISEKIKALGYLLEQVDDVLLKYCEAEDAIEWNGNDTHVSVTASKRRTVDAERVAHIVGAEVIAKYGKLNISAVDALLKGKELTDEQKLQLKQSIKISMGEPAIKTEPLPGF